MTSDLVKRLRSPAMAFYEFAADNGALLKEAADRIEALERAQAWRPVETAPKDGTTVFGCDCRQGYRGMVSFNGNEWEMVNGLTNMPMGIGFYPTHWQPLPTPPEAK